MRVVFLLIVSLALGPVLALPSLAQAPKAGAVEAVLALVPADSAATLLVPELRRHVQNWEASPMAARVAALPALRAWRNAAGARGLLQAREEIEGALGTTLPMLRNRLFGDAVALTLRLPPGAGPEGAEGMLLSVVRDRVLLEKTIERANAAERAGGSSDRGGLSKAPGCFVLDPSFPAPHQGG